MPSCSTRLAAPDLAADLDDLPGAGERLVVRHAVEALDHLRARRAEAEDRPAARQRVEPGRGHRDERRRAAVERQDAGADLDPLGVGGEVAHERDGVEAVGLGDPHDVEARLLQRDHRLDLSDRVVAVLELGGELHALSLT